MRTLQDRFCTALLSLGFNEVIGKSYKRRVFTDDNIRYMWVGKTGSVRWGRTQAKSLPVSQATRNALLSVSDKLGG